MPNLPSHIFLKTGSYFSPDTLNNTCGVCYLTFAALLDPDFAARIETLPEPCTELTISTYVEEVTNYWMHRRIPGWDIVTGFDEGIRGLPTTADVGAHHGQAAYRFHILGDSCAAQTLAETFTEMTSRSE